ncbi:cytochrome c oxidase subunit 8C, mitochondrial [Eulemur rufifrons]|uniref:Cytochrome c oxidase subunit 8C, mitochondrial n=1 Tax=Eulemur fulvus fulvus TaxID=40322 RepID=COX8C_EULFU|nr:RecName: Full=Cytochrome c oxidase subunit 8C, mitochondrial; AltName: Full=Cytochrome c oxidase polypeptide 8 isoform 3; AltName: Full=Cytochrome c oxidase polypeptide VIII isoform 3; Short=COX VIII-3; AltName: Full=Cytochrome c oxidase subunit 8-3; Flags: Precursor [Eulemur fulvus fulvus]AAO26195.1 cytochrome c oxidase subunit VIII isoform 3 precursor [Eulemur fulvus]
MAHLPRVCPFIRRLRVALLCLRPGHRFAHSEPQRQRPASALEMAVGIVVIFSAFLTPSAYVLSNLSQFRRE